MRRLLLAFAFCLAAVSAWPLSEWYDYYLKARDQLIPAGKCPEALQALQEAIRIKPSSGLKLQTYGLQFEDYLPYYWQGVCHLKMGDNANAIRLFNAEEDRRAIQKSALFKDMVAKRTEADQAERTRVARQARSELDRLFREAQDLQKTSKYEDALARLAQAEVLAKNLNDPATERRVAEAQDRIRAEAQQVTDATAREKRLEQTLQQAARLLEDEKATEAKLRFDEALGLDPKNARALEGRRLAEERILATKTRENLQQRLREGEALFQAGEYEKALVPLTDAAADPKNAAARDLLNRALRIVEGTRREKDLHARIQALLAKGEKLFAAGKYPEAKVAFEGVLVLEPGNARARERVAQAEAETGHAIFARWLPNQSPLLEILAPERSSPETPGPIEVSGPNVGLVGVAVDDRGMGRVEMRVGGRLVAEEKASPDLATRDERRRLSFRRRLDLAPGENEITIVAIDDAGAERRESLLVTRRLRFHEQPYFLPAVLGTSVGLIGLGFAAQGYRRRQAVKRRFNPYIAGAPVMDESMFFGRQKLLNRLLSVLHHNSLMITGERRIGKTTFLYHLKKVLETDEGSDYRFFPVLIDLQGVPETQFFPALMSDVAEGLGLSPATRESLRFRPGVEKYDGRDFGHDLQRVIEELKTRTSRNVKLCLLIDEVDVLNEYSESVNQRLRSIFMKTFSESLVAVMSGVGIKRTWKSEVSPWYNFFDEVELSTFTQEEAEELIKTPVTGFFTYEPAAIELILELSRLKPYLVQKFCIHAVNRMLEEGRSTITRAHVLAVRDAVRLESEEDEAPLDAASVGAGAARDL
jgi:hypothetical protein